MILYLIAGSYVGLEVRLTEMLIGRNVSGYTASRSGRLFDEVKGIVYVSRPNLWVHFAQPFAPCSDLKTLYGGHPSDVRLLASPMLEGDINLMVWSADAPDRIATVKLKTSIRKDTIVSRVPGFRLYVRDGKFFKRDTQYAVTVSGDNIRCEEEGIRFFHLGKKLEDPTFIWTGREVWVLDGKVLYAYRKGKLVKLRTFKHRAYPTADGEGTVAFYMPEEDEMFILRFSPDYSDVSTKSLRGVSRDVKGEFVSIHSVREVKKGERSIGRWVIVLLFRKDGEVYYVKVKPEGKDYTVESTDP